ncbi:MAG: YjfB family protein [Lachnospiraceae bacterium]|nr:YjfB family protein [Lachnospiraceae bacterium]
MDIAALSTAMAQTQLQNDIGTAILSKAIDSSATMGADLTKMMEQSVNPDIGGSIDISL